MFRKYASLCCAALLIVSLFSGCYTGTVKHTTAPGGTTTTHNPGTGGIVEGKDGVIVDENPGATAHPGGTTENSEKPAATTHPSPSMTPRPTESGKSTAAPKGSTQP